MNKRITIRVVTVLFILSIIFSILNAQPELNSTYGQNNQTREVLIKKYLSDTLHAAEKIRELTQLAMRESRTSSEGILKFQMSLALAPYAQDSSETLSKLYAQFSSWLYEAGAKDIAIQYAKTALFYRNKVEPRLSVGIYHLLSRIASYYANTAQFDSAKRYYSLALTESRRNNEPIWYPSATNNMGYFYEQLSLPDSALLFFQQAQSALILKRASDSSLLGSIRDNIALNFFNRKNTAKALGLYRNNISLYTELEDYTRVLQAQTGVFNCLLEEGKFEEAYYLLQDMHKLADRQNVLTDPEQYLKLLHSYETYYKAVNLWEQAYQYDERIQEVTDSMAGYQKAFLDNLVRASTENEVAKAKKDIQGQKLLTHEARNKARQNLLVAFMIGLLSLAIVFLIISYFRTRAKVMHYEQEITRKELENKRLEQEKLEQELAYKKGDLHDLGVYLSQIKELHEKVVDRIREAKTIDPRQQKEVLKSVVRELDAKIDLRDRADMIQQNIDKVNTEFYDHLLRKFPRLTKSELELCGLIKLKMSNKEIGALKNISDDSVKKYRNRLRRKIGIQPDEDIYTFIASI